MIDFFPFKKLEDGTLVMEVDGVRIFFKEEIIPGIIYKLKLRSINYNLVCEIDYDVGKKKIMSISCIGFKSDKVKAKLEEHVKIKGLFYSKWS